MYVYMWQLQINTRVLEYCTVIIVAKTGTIVQYSVKVYEYG